MIVFLNDDHAFLSWTAHHRDGYVLQGRERPRISRLVLHRAACQDLRANGKRHTHFTTAGRFMACSPNRQDLEEWAQYHLAEVTPCAACRPLDERESSADTTPRLSRLAREVLEYLVESAEIHFGRETPPYRLSITDIAGCFAKSPGQLRGVFDQLTNQGLAELERCPAKHRMTLPTNRIFPTLKALKLRGTYQAEDDAELVNELSKLHSRERLSE